MRFIESILLQDGVYFNLELHQARINTVFERFASKYTSHDLLSILPNIEINGTFKIRLEYDIAPPEPSFNLDYAEYHPRKITSLEVIHSEPFDYSFKYADRSKIDELKRQSKADDIIIAIDNQITDGSYFNLAFFDGSEWFTPNTPLLHGVRRTQLIKENKMKEHKIMSSDLVSFEKVSLINSMLDLGVLEVPVKKISF